jgi:hypothetical protein
MNWYYVEHGQQAGPVEETGFPQLIRAGKLRADTLVWREGMTNWEPFSKACPGELAASIPAAATGAEAVCAECHKNFRTEDMIRFKDVYVCAGCKPVFMQKLGEGLVTGTRRGRRQLPVDADQLIAEIEARGYEVDIGGTISRGWALYKANFGICVGATFLVLLCQQAAGFIPILGIILSLMVQGPLMAGLYNFFIRLVRGETPGIGDAFTGFGQGFWRYCGTFLLMILLVYVWFIPLGVVAIFVPANTTAFIVAMLTLGLIGLAGAVYVGVAFIFAMALSADLQLGPWDALRVSRRVVSKRWFSLFGLAILAGLLSALGILGCFIGIIFTMPILFVVTMLAYEDIFGVRS